jgi:large subunit ribosomal protein L25
MKTIEITAQLRENLGKRGAKALRFEKRVPAVIYDHSKAIHISLDYKDAFSLLHTPDAYIIHLNMGKATHSAIIREAQFHPVTDNVLHIDFLKVYEDKPVELTLPIKFVGTPKGVIAGGKLLPKLRRITVKGIPSDLPDTVDIDVAFMRLGSSIKVEDLKMDKLEITTPGSIAIASVAIPRLLKGAEVEEEEEETEEGAEGSEESSEESAEE